LRVVAVLHAELPFTLCREQGSKWISQHKHIGRSPLPQMAHAYQPQAQPTHACKTEKLAARASEEEWMAGTAWNKRSKSAPQTRHPTNLCV